MNRSQAGDPMLWVLHGTRALGVDVGWVVLAAAALLMVSGLEVALTGRRRVLGRGRRYESQPRLAGWGMALAGAGGVAFNVALLAGGSETLLMVASGSAAVGALLGLASLPRLFPRAGRQP